MEVEAPTEEMRTAETLALAEELARLEPEDRAVRFRKLSKDVAAMAFDALDPPQQAELVDALTSDRVRELVAEMEPDDRARLLDEVPAGVARRLLAQLSPRERWMTDDLLGYPPESAGRIMSPEVLSLHAGQSASEALARVRARGHEAETLYVLPVRDRQRRLLGVTSLRDIVLADPEARVSELMNVDYPVVSAYDDQEKVARLIQEADLLAVPVVDREHRLLGLVTVDDALEVLEIEDTEDITRAGGGVEPLRAPYFSVSVRQIVRSRIIWLTLLVAAATLTVSVLSAFESTLEQVVTLSLFIPLLIGTGGNCGAQAATTITRALAVGDVRIRDLPSVLAREVRVGLMLGAVFAVVGFPLITILFDREIAEVVSLSLLATCTWATLVGGMLPLVASKVGIDPAVVSAPLVTTLVDATGLLIYFGIAQVIVL
ncbi:MAG TPA: magnesium transporter [Solirubrobacterales bacterium]|nr:magnesium transporter [Solirubrobacterales bacterium]